MDVSTRFPDVSLTPPSSSSLCSYCGASSLPSSSSSASAAPHLHVAEAYQSPRGVKPRASGHSRLLHGLLVSGDCVLLGLQPILVFMSKVDGHFLFNPVSVNFLTELFKMLFAIAILILEARRSHSAGKRSMSWHSMWLAARRNSLLAVPAGLYAVNNYLKFIMQLYFKPATVKMLSNMKILVIAVLLKMVMKRRFSFMQWEALVLLLIGITVNQISCGSDGAGLAPLSPMAWLCTFLSVTIPSAASVYNEYALKKDFDTSLNLQNLFMYSYGVFFNLAFLILLQVVKGGDSYNILKGHSHATMMLIANNALQGILSSFFFKYADTILKKYSSAIATIFTALASAAMFSHTLTASFVLGVSIVIISMHQFFACQVPDAKPAGSSHHFARDQAHDDSTSLLLDDFSALRSEDPRFLRRDSSFLSIAVGANEEANHTGPLTTHSTLPK